MEELDTVQKKKLKAEKAAGYEEISPEIWKKRKLDYIMQQLCNAVYKQNITKKWTKGFILPQER